MKTCGTCGVLKPLSEFYVSQGRVRRSCKPCVIAANRRSLILKKSTPDGRQRRRAVQKVGDLRYRYRLSKEQYGVLVDAAAGRCPLCLREAALQVDHCHETGVVRGLLCGPCNKMLGLVHDDVDVLHAAIAYLEAARTLTARGG